jgi:hypothetical protein
LGETFAMELRDKLALGRPLRGFRLEGAIAVAIRTVVYLLPVGCVPIPLEVYAPASATLPRYHDRDPVSMRCTWTRNSPVMIIPLPVTTWRPP